MRKYIAFLAVLALPLFMPATASALPICGGGTDVTTYNPDGCAFNGVTLSEFSVVDAGNPGVELVNAVSAFLVNGIVNFEFNPNLATDGITQDIHFFFKVTGNLFGVDLFNGGTGDTSISEVVCSGPFSGTQCTGTTLATMNASSQQAKESYFSPVGTAYVYKDIFKGLGVDEINLSPGHLTSFTQSFHVPEPGSVMLFGLALFGCAEVVRRRRLA